MQLTVLRTGCDGYGGALPSRKLNAAAIIASDASDRILLVRLSYGSGEWGVPLGGIKKGETPENAARREFGEETGCRAGAMTAIGVERDNVYGADNAVHIFACKTTGVPKPDMREVVDARFFPSHSLPEPLSKNTRRLLAVYREQLK